MGAVFGFLKIGWTLGKPIVQKYWKEILIILIVGGTIWTIHSKNVTIAEQTTQIGNLNTQLAEAKSNLAICKNNIDDQNKKIEAAAKDSEKLQSDLSALQDKFAKDNKNNKNTIDKLRNQPAPKSCEDIKAYLKDNLQYLHY